MQSPVYRFSGIKNIHDFYENDIAEVEPEVPSDVNFDPPQLPTQPTKAGRPDEVATQYPKGKNSFYLEDVSTWNEKIVTALSIPRPVVQENFNHLKLSNSNNFLKKQY